MRGNKHQNYQRRNYIVCGFVASICRLCLCGKNASGLLRSTAVFHGRQRCFTTISRQFHGSFMQLSALFILGPSNVLSMMSYFSQYVQKDSFCSPQITRLVCYKLFAANCFELYYRYTTRQSFTSYLFCDANLGMHSYSSKRSV